MGHFAMKSTHFRFCKPSCALFPLESISCSWVISTIACETWVLEFNLIRLKCDHYTLWEKGPIWEQLECGLSLEKSRENWAHLSLEKPTVAFEFLLRLFFNVDHFSSVHWIPYNIASVVCFGFTSTFFFFDWFLKEILSSPSGNMCKLCLESFRGREVLREVWSRLPGELTSLGDWYDPGLQHAGMMQVCACVEIMFNQEFSWWRNEIEFWGILRNNSARYNYN